MGIKAYPFTSKKINGVDDRRYGVEDLRNDVKSHFRNGVTSTKSDSMQVMAKGGMAIGVAAGKGVIDGCSFSSDAEIGAVIDNPGTLDRIDRVILRKDDSETVRAVSLAIIKGTEAATPQPGEIVRDNVVYDIVLADILVKGGTSAISQSAITDQRLNPELCGIVSAVGEVDTATIFNQYQAALNDYLHIVDYAIDGTLAGRLAQSIDIIVNKTISPSSWTADASESDFKFKTDIVISGLLPTDSVTVDFNRANAESGNLSTYASEQNGKVTIYAKEQPTENVVIDKITINRKVVL